MTSPFDSPLVLRKIRLCPLAMLLLLTGCGKFFGQKNTPEPVNPHSVTITWAAASTPVAGYNVYRTSRPGGPVKLTPRIVSTTQFTDKTAEGGRTYLYYVTSVDSKGIESNPSEQVTITVPTTVTPPAKQ
jgi:hypothetical protein